MTRESAAEPATDPAVEPTTQPTRRHDDVTVRPMRWWDLPAAAEIDRAAFGVDAWSVETFWSELAARDTRRYLVAVDPAGSVVGYAGVAVVAGEADLQTILVAGSHRGRGLGRRLLDAVTREASTAGGRRMHLEVRADNAAARTLYAASGYHEDGRRRGYYREPGAAGGPVDAVTMSRRLP